MLDDVETVNFLPCFALHFYPQLELRLNVYAVLI